jgi:hypothetical protein
MFSKMFKGRKATASALPTSTSSALPVLPTQATPVPTSVPAPTYAHADRQKGAIDKENDDKDHEDQDISAAQGKSAADTRTPITGPKLTPPTNRVTNNQPSTQPSTSAAPANDHAAYMAYWNLANDVQFEEEIFEKPSFWTPNFWSIINALAAASTFVINNRIIEKTCPDYNDYAVYCYYAILFYIQILRAQRDAGLIDGIDASFLRRFERRWNPEQLPISSFLMPHFTNITALLLPDERHSWIIPQYANMYQQADGTAMTYRTLAYPNADCLLQPIIPYMLAILRLTVNTSSQTYTTATAHDLFDTAGNNNYSDNDYPFWNDKDQFIPLSTNVPRTDGTYDVINTRRFDRASIAVQPGNNQHDEFARILASPGLNVPVELTPDSMSIMAKYWQRTSFYEEITVQAVNTTPVAATRRINHNNTVLAADIPFRSLEEFLLMPKSSNLDWFEALVNNAATHARCFKGVNTLSQVPTTSGQTPVILAQFSQVTSNRRFGRTVRDLAPLTSISSTGTDAAAITRFRTLQDGWYANILKDTVASFSTSRSAPLRSEELQALCFATNAALPFYVTVNDAAGNGHNVNVGAPASDTMEDISPYAGGSFFTEDRFVRRTAAAASPSSRTPMFKGWKTMIQQNFALERPTGY